MTITIQADALYPRDGVDRITRQYCPNAEAWPTIQVGDHLEVIDTQGWLWDAEVTAVQAADNLTAKVENKRPSPLPEIKDGTITLPNRSGHAHCRSWRTGDIVHVHGAYYKIKGKPRPSSNHSQITYSLVEIDEKTWATRPGRIHMPSEQAAREAVGSAVQTPSGEWLEAKEVKFRKYGSAEGETFGLTWLVFGRHVPESKAAKINYTHPRWVSAALHNAKAARHQGPMPEDAVTLIARNHTSLAATGERIAIVGKVILHERCGDPDMIDSWHHYIVAIEDKELLARVKKTIVKLAKK